MTDRDWQAFTAELEATFRGDLAPDREAALKVHCGDWPLETARQAIAVMVGQGRVHMPTPGEMVVSAQKASVPEAPSFGEAWPLICRLIGFDSDRKSVARVQERLGDGPAVFVSRYGARRLGIEPVNGDHGGAIMARLEAAYNEACRAVAEDGRVAMTLRSGEPRRLGAGLPGLGVGDG